MNESAFLLPEFAEFYDWLWDGYDADLAFYQRFASQYGQPVLEVDCGTGRVTRSLARAGYEVTALGCSPAMLDVARRKIAAEPPDVRQRVTIQQGSITGFDMERDYPLVIMPTAAVFHVQGRYSLTRCFKDLFRHTQPGGVCVVDCISPELVAEQQVGLDEVVKDAVNPATGLRTRAVNRRISIHWDTQTACIEHRFTEGDGDSAKEHVFHQDYRWLRREEGVDLLQRAGYPVVNALGNFDGGNFTRQSPRLIFVARRLERDVW